MEEVIRLNDLTKDLVPVDFRAETYFDFKEHPFAHQSLFEQTNSVIGAIVGINEYATHWLTHTIAQKRQNVRVFKNAISKFTHTFGNFEVILEDGAVFEPARIIGNQIGQNSYTIYLEKDATVVGSDIYLDKASIYIGTQTTVESCVAIKGPTIIGKNSEIRQGAYLRGNCILGDSCVIRGELKNVVIMNGGSFPHPSYVGDSLCGYMTHFGNQVTAANLGIYEGIRDPEKYQSIIVSFDGKAYDLGRSKIGICLGDFSQVGCNSVSDPATFLKPYTIIYALTRITKGFYGPNEVLKNKPLKYGVIERVPFKPFE
ncbi:MAG: hypothetical protein JSW07_14635 [bacterium]|nr:MAG: hypothetical protein JSW07_14635 [bacterium]